LFLPPVVFAQDILEELEIRGFTKYLLLDYEKKGEVEYFTFSDWMTTTSGDTITFIVIGGEVTDWLKKEARDNIINSLDI
jgi:hypothetical protein